MTSKRPVLGALTLALSVALAGCNLLPTATSNSPASITVGASIEPAETGQAVVGLVTDYGQCDDGEKQVAAMVKGWNTDVVVTTGDNTQGVKGCVPFTESVGAYYDDVIKDPRGPRFYPTTGNHDYEDVGAGIAAYTAYFDYLPTNADLARRWYSLEVGPARFFMIDSDAPEADMAAQKSWLKDALAATPKEKWKVVMYHRPPFTSGPHDPDVEMRPEAGWAYRTWGADIVLNGHQHVFEDVVVDGLHYVTTGVGGKVLERECAVKRVPGSQVCVPGPGAVLMRIDATTFSVDYHLLDTPETSSYHLQLTR